MKKALLLLTCLSPVTAFGCELYEADNFQSVMIHSEKGLCFSLGDGFDYAVGKFHSLDLIPKESDSSFDYWSDWILQSDVSPLMTQNIASNYFGVGVWMPNKLQQYVNDMTTEQWIRNHGLQLSLGFGDKHSGDPRLRLDYRWHERERYRGDFFLQLEIPIN
ncbi:hypothetical protein [Vibrio sp.]|uniref:hypothetical protein n=1 Tax=Vibrio sp. TaxID=678 RepID=UPI003D098270